MRIGGPFANRDHEGHRVQTGSVHFRVFTVFSVCTAVLVVFYQGLPVYRFYGTASFLTEPRGNGFTVFVKCSRVTAYWRTSGINVEIHVKLFMVYGLSPFAPTT